MKKVAPSDIVTTEENEKILFSFDVDLETNAITDSKINPTEVEYEKVEWLYASNNKYPEYKVNHNKVGKWMLFIHSDQVNQVWAQIKAGIVNGELWHSKVTTNNSNSRVHAIMIYTKDYTDLEDVIRVLDYLEQVELKPKNVNIRYKADWQTRAGIYSGGKKRPWIYASETIREKVAHNASQSSDVTNKAQSHSQINNLATISGASTSKQRAPSAFSLTHNNFFQALAQEDKMGKEKDQVSEQIARLTH